MDVREAGVARQAERLEREERAGNTEGRKDLLGKLSSHCESRGVGSEIARPRERVAFGARDGLGPLEVSA